MVRVVEPSASIPALRVCLIAFGDHQAWTSGLTKERKRVLYELAAAINEDRVVMVASDTVQS